MLDFLMALVHAVPAAAPLVSAGGILYCAYKVILLGSNHLHTLPQVTEDIAEMKEVLKEIRDCLIILKDRSDAAR